MTQIRIDTEYAREVGRRLVADGDRVAEIGHELARAIGGLDTWAWDGVSRSRAESLLGQVRPAGDGVAQGLEELGQKLVRVAEAFEGEDNTAARNFGDLGWVEFGTEARSAILPERPALDNMQDLYKQVKSVDDYNPIKIVQIGDNEYLILLEGTSDKGGHNMGSAIQAGLGMSSTYERQVREYISEHITEGAVLHFAGHSQGGIVANNIADNQDFLGHYTVASVTTFGSPTSAYQDWNNIEYNPYAAEGDIVPMLDRDALVVSGLGIIGAGYLSSKSQKQVSGGGFGDGIFAPHSYYDRAPELLKERLPFEVKEWREIGSFRIEARDGMSYAWQNLESDNWFNKACGLIDFSTEGTKDFFLAKADVDIETISSQFPEPIRDGIDRYKDRAYDNIAELPTLTQTAGGIVNFTQDTAEAITDLGGEMVDKTGEFFSNVFSR